MPEVMIDLAWPCLPAPARACPRLPAPARACPRLPASAKKRPSGRSDTTERVRQPCCHGREEDPDSQGRGPNGLIF